MFVLEPPPCYLHPYLGQVQEIILSAEEVEKRCSNAPHSDACMYPPMFHNGVCIIVLPKVGPGGVGQGTQDALRRHEIAHCNGWPADHRMECPT